MQNSEVRRRARAKDGGWRQPDGCEAGGTTRSVFEPGWSEVHFEALWLPQAGHGPAQASGFDQTAWSFGVPAGRVAASRTAASPSSAWGRKRTAVFRTSRIQIVSCGGNRLVCADRAEIRGPQARRRFYSWKAVAIRP